MSLEAFEKKLHIARDVEDNPNFEELEIIRGLENEMNKYESFVGLAPFGSVLGGYGVEESDIDIFILYDEPSTSDSSEKVSDYDKLWPRAFEWQEEMQKNGHKVDFIFQNVNPDNLIKSMKSWISDRGDLGEYVPLSLEAMTRVVTGKKIEQYRKALAVGLKEFDSEQKQIVKDTIVSSLLKRDELSFLKRKRRIPMLSEEEHKKILGEREKMWRNRVQKIWNL